MGDSIINKSTKRVLENSQEELALLKSMNKAINGREDEDIAVKKDNSNLYIL
jgi:hypothetical protein